MGLLLQEVELIGNRVSLIPLEKTHKEGLLKAASDGNLWELWFTSVPSIKNIDSYIETALHSKDMLAFTIINNADNSIIGCTRFCNIGPNNYRLEIGYTWYAKSVQRTGINSECKLLLLKHAFESLDCIAVEFRTHWFNTASRNAIAKLGAKQDGVLRNHRIDADGVFRDTVVFSIIKSEWKTVKRSLEFKLKKGYS